MALKIRLRQQGRTNRPFYRLVLTDVRAPRDGKYLELLGWYNPFEAEVEKSISVNAERIKHWLNLGAELTESAQQLVVKTAPAVIRSHTEKTLANKAKAASKRKVRNKASANQ